MGINFFLKTLLIQIVFCFSLIIATPLKSQAEIENKNPKVHHDARKLRKHAYSSLYWCILTSIMYHKTQQDYSWFAALCGLFAINNGINMLHYFHEAHCAAHEEETALDIIKCYITDHSK